jgi:dihydroflavonol-4-reductase
LPSTRTENALNKNSPILLTGATGFVGSYVARQLLQAGYTNLYAVRRADSQLDLLGPAAAALQWREAELADYFSIEDALAGMEVVIHCAALVSFLPQDKDRLLQVNRNGTRYVVNAALHHGVPRLIYLSSVAALGRNNHGQLIDESAKWVDGPTVSNYSRSKFLAEQELWRGQAEGLAVAAVYPSVVLGAGRWQEGTPKMFAYAQQQPTFYPAGSTGFVDVRDVARAVQLVLERDTDGDRFLLNGEHLTFQQLLTLMAEALGHRPPQKMLPATAAHLLAWLEGWRSWLLGTTPLLTRETVRATYLRHVYDSRRSEEVLGLEYRDLAQTIRETATLLQANGTAKSAIFPLPGRAD